MCHDKNGEFLLAYMTSVISDFLRTKNIDERRGRGGGKYLKKFFKSNNIFKTQFTPISIIHTALMNLQSII